MVEHEIPVEQCRNKCRFSIQLVIDLEEIEVNEDQAWISSSRENDK